jgi:O-antigen/teichoic acid export membrane protein
MALLSEKAWTAFWSATLQWSKIGLNAMVFLILSRWLTLSEIGAVAAAQAPILFFQTTLASAMADATVREDTGSQRSLSSLFWLSLLCGCVVSLGLFMLSPVLAGLIDSPASLPYFQVLAMCPAIWSIACVSEGRLRKLLNVRALAIRTTCASLIAGMSSIFLLSLGFGAWAIVAFLVINAASSSLLTLIAQRWLPSFEFDVQFIRSIMPRFISISGRYFMSSMQNPLIQFIVIAQLGLHWGGAFQLALRLQALIGALVVAPLRYLALPLFTRAQARPGNLQAGLLSAIAIGSCIASPSYLGALAVAPDLLPLALGEANGKAAAELFQILSLYGPFLVPVSLINEALTAAGLALVVLRRSFVMYALVIVPCAAAAFHSVILVCIIYAVAGGIIGFALSASVSKRFLGLDPKTVLLNFGRPLLAAMIMAFLVRVLGNILTDFSPVFRLSACILFGAITYSTLLYFLARPQVMIFVNALRRNKLRSPQ